MFVPTFLRELRFGGVMKKIKVHLWTLPRWFALPVFAAPAILEGCCQVA